MRRQFNRWGVKGVVFLSESPEFPVNPDQYQKALKFSGKGELPTDPDLQKLLSRLDYTQENKEIGKDTDHTFRGVLADKLQDLGRDEEAALLRDRHPVRVEGLKLPKGEETHHTGGKVVPNYQHFVWPGGAPLIYHHEKGPVSLCPHCIEGLATERAKQLAEGETEDLPTHPKEFTPFTHEEGSPFYCDDCNKEIPALYGDPDNPDEER